MPDLVISVRRVVRRKGVEQFEPEPGEARFLKVPANQLPKPSHKMPRGQWVDRVMAEAHSGVNDHTGKECGDIVVFIHGYNNDNKAIMWRHRRLQQDLREQGFVGAVVSFDWPSDDRGINYLEDRSDAKKTALHLVNDCIRLFAATQFRGCEINVHLVAHSTGAYVIREAFDDADDRANIASVNWTVSQICLLGADVSSKSMHSGDSKSSSIYRHCVRLTNYQNPYDSVLKLSNIKRVGVAPRVGRVGMPDDIPHNAVNVNCGDYFSTKKEAQSDFIGSFDHSWHIGDPRFAEDLYHTIQGDIDRQFIPTRSVEGGVLKLRS